MIELTTQEKEQALQQPQLMAQASTLWEESLKKSTNQTLITNKEQFHTVLEQIDRFGTFCYDTETNGTFDFLKIALVGISLAWFDTEVEEVYSCYIPLSHWWKEPYQLPIEYVLEHLTPFFESLTHEKICHNTKFDEQVLKRYGIEVKGVAHDTYVMAWLLSEDTTSMGLKPQIEHHFHIKMETYEDVVEAAPRKKGQAKDYNFARVEVEGALRYAAADAYWCYRLFLLFKEKLIAEKLWQPYQHIERPFVRILRHIEGRGVRVDQDLIKFADEQLPRVIDKVEAEIYEEAGEVFNIGSSKQLGPILFEKMGIGKNIRRTASGDYSTDKKTLALYAQNHKIVENVLRRKKIAKTHTTFVQGLKESVKSDGRIHPSFNGCGTVTGRLSCRKPNLQQIEGDEVEEVRIRDFFIPQEGYKFIVADYGQIELRIMAHFAKDQAMIDAFASGRDFHEETARKMFNLGPDDEVETRQRFYAKAINFGIGYGRGPVSVAEQIKCSEKEAKEYIAFWSETFPDVIQFKKKVVALTREYGYVRTLSGRKRRLPDIKSNNWGLRGRAERQAFNTKIQGSAADIIKLAMIALEPRLDKLNSAMIMQIHDELVVEAPEQYAEETLATVEQTMENPYKDKNPLILPLVADAKIVDKWGDAK